MLIETRGSVSPFIGIAIYQADGVAATYKTIGYLIPIMTVIAIPIMPRAKFIQTLFLNVLACCIACVRTFSSFDTYRH